jgi:hypothetical protein
MLVGVGMANYILLVYYFDKKSKKIRQCFYVFLISTFAFGCHSYLGMFLKMKAPEFIQSDLKIFLISGFFSVLVYLLLKRNLRFFLVLLLPFAFYSVYYVNPLYRGLSPINDSELNRKILELNSRYNSSNDSWWVYYDSWIMGNYIFSTGVKVFNVTNFYPHIEYWRRFDPEGKYFDVYNRYAHIEVNDNNGEEISFRQMGQGAFAVEINPCNSILSNQKVDFFVFNRKTDYSCLEEIDVVTYPSYLYVYHRKK